MSFDLKSVTRTRRLQAPKIVLAGEHKIGKSTFAACASNAIGICTEDGLTGIDTSAFPLCKTLADVYEAIGTLLNDPHDFGSVFLDSLDWTEPLLHDHVCRANKWDNIEAPGYGKGYVAAACEWKNLLDGFEALRRERGMADDPARARASIKRIDSPDARSRYERVGQPKLHDRSERARARSGPTCGAASRRISAP
jgi:hypothetical protein